jgi:hypothetical protein
LTITPLAVMTAGIMPAACLHCGWRDASVPNIHTYAEQSSGGNPFDLVWIWLESFAPTIL